MPAWGYMIAGRLTIRYGDHEEVIEPGVRARGRRQRFPSPKLRPVRDVISFLNMCRSKLD
jgi:hypothetical protein